MYARLAQRPPAVVMSSDDDDDDDDVRSTAADGVSVKIDLHELSQRQYGGGRAGVRQRRREFTPDEQAFVEAGQARQRDAGLHPRGAQGGSGTATAAAAVKVPLAIMGDAELAVLAKVAVFLRV